MKVFFWITVVLVLSKYRVYSVDEPCCVDYCLEKDTERPQNRKFTSNTAYQLARGNDLDIGFHVPNCTATKFWVTTRHGTRLPYYNIIKTAPSRLEEIKGQIFKNYLILQTKPDKGALCMEDFLLIQSWKFNSSITPDMKINLAPQGWNDLKYLSTTYQQIFPNILVKEYNSSNYVFHHTKNQRAEESFKAFAEGLFGPNVYQNIDRYLVPERNDTLLRAYQGCPAWKENSWKTYNTEESEYFMFRQTDLVKKTVSDISRRLGFPEPLDFKDIQLMWDVCRLEQAWFQNRSSNWCAAFTPGQITILEYLDDLRIYRTSSYGHELNSRVSCNLAQDLLLKLNNDDGPNAVAYISHSNTIETLITALGMRKDSVPPTANNFESMFNRQWKTSEINPFASNLVAVKFECSTEDSKSNESKAMFFLNQRRVDLDWCDHGLCDWSRVLKQYEHIHKANCTEYFCSTSPSTNGGKIPVVGLLLFLFVFVILVLFN